MLYLLPEKDAGEKLHIGQKGHIILPFSVEGYGVVRGGVCWPLVIGVQLMSYEEVFDSFRTVLGLEIETEPQLLAFLSALRMPQADTDLVKEMYSGSRRAPTPVPGSTWVHVKRAFCTNTPGKTLHIVPPSSQAERG